MDHGGWISKEHQANRNPQPLTLKYTPKNAVQAGQAPQRFLFGV
jgi:hypothetical protein